MASVRKLRPKDPASPWVCEYTDAGGKRRRYQPKTGLKKDADTFRRKIEGELERGEHVALSETVTVAVAIDAFVRHCHKRAAKGDRMTLATVEMYGDALDRVTPRLGAIKLTALTTAQIQGLVDELATTLSGWTVWHSYRTLYLVLQHAVAQGWLKKSPADTRRMSLPAKKRRAAVPSKDEIRVLLQAACDRIHGEHHQAHRNRIAIVALALFGGLRRGEIVGLRWQDIDHVRGVIHIRHSMSRLDGLKSPKTKAGVRDVPLSQPIVAALKGLNELHPDPAMDDHVVVSRNGKPLLPSHITSEYWYMLMRKAKLTTPEGKVRYRFHDLRHTAVSLLIDQGLSPLHIKNMIGHASVTTTLDVYGHMFPQDGAIRRAADEVAAGFYATTERLAIASS